MQTKLSIIIKGERKLSMLEKNKLKEFMTMRPALHGRLKGTLGTEGKDEHNQEAVREE